jgi:elongation factor P hydroxylase
MQDIQIITLFNKTFQQAYNTRLVSGGEEPEYIPADNRVEYHRIIYKQDYIASALHEIAHWCIAGEVRRQQHDYGYWYIPDGRNQQQQAEFESVESKSQALEWVFSNACKRQFVISVDNLDNDQSRFDGAKLNFKHNIVEQARRYCQGGLNTRASLWCRELNNEVDVGELEPPHYLNKANYSLDTLR